MDQPEICEQEWLIWLIHAIIIATCLQKWLICQKSADLSHMNG